MVCRGWPSSAGRIRCLQRRCRGFPVAVTTLGHENAEDFKVFRLKETLDGVNRLRNTKVAPVDRGILGARECFVERREKGRLFEDAHDRFRDFGHELFVGVHKVAG